MNAKTSRLISKYSTKTEESQKAIKRRWNAMNHEERHQFRVRMRAAAEAK